MLSLMVTTLLWAVMAVGLAGLGGLMVVRSVPARGTISRPDKRARGWGGPEEGPGLVSGITLLTMSSWPGTRATRADWLTLVRGSIGGWAVSGLMTEKRGEGEVGVSGTTLFGVSTL